MRPVAELRGDERPPADAPLSAIERREQSEVLIGDEAIKALNPAVSGPAIQVLPLAICTYSA